MKTCLNTQFRVAKHSGWTNCHNLLGDLILLFGWIRSNWLDL